MSIPRHRHVFTALWWNFGRFGRQDVHVHGCFKDGCEVHLIGEGRKCSGDQADHHREQYDDEKGWVKMNA